MGSATHDNLAELPTPDTITLLLKCHKSTTVLSVLPTTPFTEIKTLLLAALQARNLKTLPNSTVPLPEDPEDLELGVLADKKDASKGWVPVDIKEREVMGSRGAKKRAGAADSTLNQTPLGAGLSDGAWLAYRVKAEQKHGQAETADDDMTPGTPDIDIEEDPGWDVVLPSFDDEDE